MDLEPRRQQKIKAFLGPVENFMNLESSSGIVLLLTTLVTMLWANSPWGDIYEHFIHTEVTLAIGSWALTHSLQHWVNDGLMVVFFFVVGMEIKRELMAGELSSPRKAALPMFAAIGGMAAPALIYLYFNFGLVGQHGWGIPMATDIAFAVGILTLMAKKVPFALRVFLLALAIVDDLGAVLVIAFFYTESIHPQALGMAMLCVGLIYVLRYAGVRKHLVYILISLGVWFFIMKSGIHATVAGVIVGLLTPLDPLYPLRQLPKKLRAISDDLDKEMASSPEKELVTLSESANQKIDEMFHYVVEAKNPIDRVTHVLHPWVGFLVMPIFAFVNAGVDLRAADMSMVMQNEITLGVFFGLLLGKPIGVLAFSMLAVRFKVAQLPEGTTWYHVTAVGFLAGIGFTMALFISHLGLKTPELEVFSKVGILLASVSAATIGLVMLYFVKDQPKKNL